MTSTRSVKASQYPRPSVLISGPSSESADLDQGFPSYYWPPMNADER
jgi:hypothetical protein